VGLSRLLADHLNTVRDIATYDSQTGTTVVNHLVYDAFGRVTSETDPAVDSLFLFTARPFDPDTQLQSNLNRWYDARVGRWLSEDPIGFATGDGNLYRYVGNGPEYSADSIGLVTCPGGEWIWCGSSRGGQIVIGYYYYKVKFTCKYAYLVGYWELNCGENCVFRQDVYTVPVASGSMSVLAVGFGLDGTLFAFAAGKVTGAMTSDDLAGVGASVGAGVTVIAIGGQVSGLWGHTEASGGLDIGVGASVSIYPSYTRIWAAGYEVFVEPLREDILNLINRWSCSRSYRPIQPVLVSTPSNFRFSPAW